MMKPVILRSAENLVLKFCTMISNAMKRIALAIWRHWTSLSTAIVDRSTEKCYLGAAERRTSWRTAVVRSHPLHVAMYVYLVFDIFRFLFASYVMRTGHYLERYLDLDVVVAMEYHSHLIDYIAAICVVPLPIFVLYYDYVVFFRRFNYIVHLANDIMVVNGTRFWRLNAHLRPPSIRLLLTQPITSVRRLWTIAKQFNRIENCSKSICVNFDRSPLKYYPYMSVIDRMRLVAINCLLNLFSSAFIVSFFLFCIFFWIYFMILMLLPNIEPTWRRLSTAILDTLMLLLCVVNTIQLVLFMMQMFLSVSFAMTFFYHDLERQFRQLLLRTEFEQYRISNINRHHRNNINLGRRMRSNHQHHSGSAVIKMIRFLHFFRVQQTRLIMHAVQTNGQIVSPVILAGAVSNFLLNIYLINALYFLPLAATDRVWISIILSLQTLFTALALPPLVSLINMLHRPAKSMLFRAQSCLRPSDARTRAAIIRAKIKLLAQYELMHTDKRFYFTLGSIAEISGKSIFKFVFVYSYYIMFLFSIILTTLDSRLNK